MRPEAPRPRALSRTRSKTTTVSYSEYPRMVRMATTVSGVTWKPNSEYTPDGDQEVVDQRDEGRDGHLRLEPQADVDADGDEEGDQGHQRVLGDLAAPGRPDVGDRHRLPGGEFLERRLDVQADGLLLGLRERVEVGLDLDRLATQDLDGRLGQPRRLDRLDHRRLGHPRGQDLPGGPALEVDPEVEAPDAEGAQAGQDDDPGEEEPPPAPSDEVEPGLAPVETEQDAEREPARRTGGPGPSGLDLLDRLLEVLVLERALVELGGLFNSSLSNSSLSNSSLSNSSSSNSSSDSPSGRSTSRPGISTLRRLSSRHSRGLTTHPLHRRPSPG